MYTRPSHYPQPPFHSENEPHRADATDEAFDYREATRLAREGVLPTEPDEYDMPDFGQPSDESYCVQPGQTTFYLLDRKGKLPITIEGHVLESDPYRVHVANSARMLILGRHVFASRESAAMHLITKNEKIMLKAVTENAKLIAWARGFTE